MPPDGVLVKPAAPGELADVEPVRGGAELVDDRDTVVVGEGTADDAGRSLHQEYCRNPTRDQ